MPIYGETDKRTGGTIRIPQKHVPSGTPSDNQPIESFWQTLEREMPDIRHLPFEEAKRTIVNYIELYYNSSRLHSGIGYRVPNEFFSVLSVHSS